MPSAWPRTTDHVVGVQNLVPFRVSARLPDTDQVLPSHDVAYYNGHRPHRSLGLEPPDVRARSPPSGDASSAALSSAGSTTYINGRRDRHDGVLGPYSRPSLPEGHRIRPARKSPCTGPKDPCGAGYQIGGTHDLILVPHTHNFALRDGGGTWNGDALTLMKSEVDTRTGLRETPSAAPSILPARNQPDRAREVAVASCHLSIRPEMLEQEKKLEWTISHLLKANTSRGARRHN